MLQRGAEVNKQNSYGDTALICAASNGQERVVDMLLQRGAEVNLQDSEDQGQTVALTRLFPFSRF